MPAFNPIVASLNFTKASTFSSGVQQFVSDRNLIFASFQYGWSDFTDWLQQPSKPQVYACSTQLILNDSGPQLSHRLVSDIRRYCGYSSRSWIWSCRCHRWLFSSCFPSLDVWWFHAGCWFVRNSDKFGNAGLSDAYCCHLCSYGGLLGCYGCILCWQLRRVSPQA